MQLSCVSIFVAVLLITRATQINGGHVPLPVADTSPVGTESEHSPQEKSFKMNMLTELLDDPNSLPFDLPYPGGLLSRLWMVYKKFRDTSELQLDPLPISKIKGRLLTSDEGCGFSKVMNTRIIGGQDAEKGGSLITSRHVLTAAHCVDHELYFVRLGEHDTRTRSDGPTQNVKVERTAELDYNTLDMNNDIAILYLERDVWFTERVRPICLPVSGRIRNDSFVNTNPFVAGWGRREVDGRLSPVLQQLQLPVLENNVCTKEYESRGFLMSPNQFSSEVLCVGYTASIRDSCFGDSGGPLMLPYIENGEFPFYQIGIVAYGYGCGHQNISSAYTNVAFYADWILEKLKI